MSRRYPIVTILVHSHSSWPNSTQHQREMARAHRDISPMRQAAVTKDHAPLFTPFRCRPRAAHAARIGHSAPTTAPLSSRSRPTQPEPGRPACTPSAQSIFASCTRFGTYSSDWKSGSLLSLSPELEPDTKDHHLVHTVALHDCARCTHSPTAGTDL